MADQGSDVVVDVAVQWTYEDACVLCDVAAHQSSWQLLGRVLARRIGWRFVVDRDASLSWVLGPDVALPEALVTVIGPGTFLCCAESEVVVGSDGLEHWLDAATPGGLRSA